MSTPTLTQSAGDFDDFRAWEVEVTERPAMTDDLDPAVPAREYRRGDEEWQVIREALYGPRHRRADRRN